MRLIATKLAKAYKRGPPDGKYYEQSSFTRLESGSVQEVTDFVMEEYTFRLSVLYLKDLGQVDKSVGELLLPSPTKALVQDGHFQNAHASLLSLGSARCISCLRCNRQVDNIYHILHQVEDLPLEGVLERC
jgi:hypothetical protein